MDVPRRREIDDAVVDLARRQNYISSLAGGSGGGALAFALHAGVPGSDPLFTIPAADVSTNHSPPWVSEGNPMDVLTPPTGISPDGNKTIWLPAPGIPTLIVLDVAATSSAAFLLRTNILLGGGSVFDLSQSPVSDIMPSAATNLGSPTAHSGNNWVQRTTSTIVVPLADAAAPANRGLSVLWWCNEAAHAAIDVWGYLRFLQFV
jgi:hypothetical protein